MKTEKLVEQLEDALHRVGYTVRLEKGDFHGGSCVFKSEHMMFVNRRMGLEERAQVMARVLAGEDLDQLFLLPEVRSFIEKFEAAPGADVSADSELSPNEAT